MLKMLALLSLAGAACLLGALSAIDLKERILPNELVAGVLALGAVFHLYTSFSVLAPVDMALGALTGAGLLYIIRAAGNRLYGQDTLGLGDVKLMGAAGLWLGPYYILIALVAGAMAGIVQGLGEMIYKKARKQGEISLATLSLPAGPGFAVGSIIAAAILLYETRAAWL